MSFDTALTTALIGKLIIYAYLKILERIHNTVNTEIAVESQEIGLLLKGQGKSGFVFFLTSVCNIRPREIPLPFLVSDIFTRQFDMPSSKLSSNLFPDACAIGVSAPCFTMA